MTEREILERVAGGELSPAEAAELLEHIDAAGTAPSAPSTGEDAQAPSARIRFVGSFRAAKIIGDPEVKEAVVDGPHLVRREGDTLVIEDDADEVHDAVVGAIHQRHGGAYRFRSTRRPRVIITAEGPFGQSKRPAPIEVRMNPALPLDVELAAGTLTVRGVRGPISADVSAGSARIEGFEQPIDLRVAAGSVHASGVLNSGESRIKCEAGSVAVQLREGSSVRISSRVGLGKVEIPDDGSDRGSGFTVGVGVRKGVVGAGDGSLDIDCSLGKVSVTVER